MPIVSVIIPTFNRCYMLIEALQSVLAQSMSDLEVIVVDDGSTDDTSDKIKTFGDERIKYFAKENGGVSSARNLGLEQVNGQYICFLDSDDIWPMDFLEVMIDSLSDNPEYSAAYCNRTLLFPDGNTKQAYMNGKSGYLAEELFKKSFIQTSTIFFKKEVVADLRFDESIGNSEDGDMWLRVSTRGKFLFVPKISVIYRQGFNQPAESELTDKEFNRIRVLERFYFRSGGDKYVSKRTAFKKLSHAYRSIGKKTYKQKLRKAALYLFAKSILYCPIDLRLYIDYTKAFFLNKDTDPQPCWKMPEPLADNDFNG